MRQQTPQAVADKHNVVWVDAKFLRIFSVAQKVDACLSVLKRMCSGERSTASPCSTIERNQNIPSRTPDGICKIQVLFVPRKTVQHQHCRVRPFAGCDVNDGIHLGSVARNVRPSHRRRMDRIGRRIRDDRGGNMLRIFLRFRAVGERQHRTEHDKQAASSLHGWNYIANCSRRKQAITRFDHWPMSAMAMLRQLTCKAPGAYCVKINCSGDNFEDHAFGISAATIHSAI